MTKKPESDDEGKEGEEKPAAGLWLTNQVAARLPPPLFAGQAQV